VPFTPFHFGPGLALAGLTRRASFVAFVAANVLIDLESGWNLWRHAYPVHAFFHSALGATLTIAPAALLAALACRIGVRAGVITRRPAPAALALGAALGAWSHVVLDAVMHADARPLGPFGDGNPLLGAIPLAALHAGCLLAGVFGAVALVVSGWRRRAAARAASR
jgi:membrane-bound metal-dependent hydrolase YbcI (DUF457 family)